MKAIETYQHFKNSEREECMAVFKVGKFNRPRDFSCYRLPGDVWRMTKNDKEVKIKAA